MANPTLVKSSTNVPGISDHEIVNADFEAKVHHQKTPPRKCYVYKKAKWEEITKDLNKTPWMRSKRKRNKELKYNASKSAFTISWSDIPGTLVDDLTKVGFVTNTRSKRFSSLVGRLCICVKLNASVMSINHCCATTKTRTLY
jgi:hypothetical protein